MSKGQTVVYSYPHLKEVHDMQPFALDLPALALFNNLINKLLFVCGSIVIVQSTNLLHGKSCVVLGVIGQNTSRGSVSCYKLSCLRTSKTHSTRGSWILSFATYKQYFLYLWVALYPSSAMLLSNRPVGIKPVIR